MISIESLKNDIEHKTVSDKVILFVNSENDFISNQYVDAISKLKNMNIEYVSEENLVSDDLFSTSYSYLRVYHRAELTNLNLKVLNEKNLILICDKISKELKDKFSDVICEVPKLEDWQIQDYVYSKLDGVDSSKLDELIAICKKDIYRIDREISKIEIFSEKERPYVFDDFMSDGVFSDLTKYSVFDLTNAVVKRDIAKVGEVYGYINNIDVDPMGFLAILTNSFRDVLTLQLDPRLKPEDLYMPKNKFWAIKYNCGFYSNMELIKIYQFITTLDKKVKTGEISTEILIDYIITKILRGFS